MRRQLVALANPLRTVTPIMPTTPDHADPLALLSAASEQTFKFEAMQVFAKFHRPTTNAKVGPMRRIVKHLSQKPYACIKPARNIGKDSRVEVAMLAGMSEIDRRALVSALMRGAKQAGAALPVHQPAASTSGRNTSAQTGSSAGGWKWNSMTPAAAKRQSASSHPLPLSALPPFPSSWKQDGALYTAASRAGQQHLLPSAPTSPLTPFSPDVVGLVDAMGLVENDAERSSAACDQPCERRPHVDSGKAPCSSDGTQSDTDDTQSVSDGGSC